MQDGERLTVVRRVGDVQGILAVYHIPDGGHPDQPALDVLASVLGEQSSGRLYKALVDNKKATQVFANAMQQNEPGLIMFGALLNKTDSLDEARNDHARHHRRRGEGTAQQRGSGPRQDPSGESKWT